MYPSIKQHILGRLSLPGLGFVRVVIEWQIFKSRSNLLPRIELNFFLLETYKSVYNNMVTIIIFVVTKDTSNRENFVQERAQYALYE